MGEAAGYVSLANGYSGNGEDMQLEYGGSGALVVRQLLSHCLLLLQLLDSAAGGGMWARPQPASD